jgi:hypothetical protein
VTTNASLPQVILHHREAAHAPFRLDPAQIHRIARKWRPIIRDRVRWRGTDARAELERQAQDQVLALLQGDRRALATVARARHAELEFRCEFDVLPALAQVPWEALLALATEGERYGRHLTITRCWRPEKLPTTSHPEPAPEVLFAACAPGRLWATWGFDFEQKLVLGADQQPRPPSKNPSLDDLVTELRQRRPRVVHLTGFDARQARRVGVTFEPDETDGFIVRGEPGAAEKGRLVRPEQLAEHVAESGADLVTCNFHYSAAPTCLELLRCGIPYAVGLHDQLDDLVAEMFFGEFFRTWRGGGMPNDRIHTAFIDARERVTTAHGDAMTGSGLVLWTTRPAIHEGHASALPPDDEARERPAHQGPVSPTLKVAPRRRLNYAMLHNGISPFHQFRILLPVPDTEGNAEVKISLNGGSPYTAKFRANSAVLDLRDRIRLPLNTEIFLLSHRTEATNAQLEVCVSLGGDDLLRDSYPVSLAPVNEWGYGGEWTGSLLPSFVLPRDPVIPQVVASAEPILRALVDDPTAGFQGYGPGASADVQARALWHTLLSGYALSYIAALPGLHLGQQRLRFPSIVMSGRQGTCIDLALLLAALFEHVGIHPVLVLTKDHALVGYWRDFAAYDSFLRVTPRNEDASEVDDDIGCAGQLRPWEVRERHSEIEMRSDSGDLVLLEATGVATRKSFEFAKEKGRAALLSKAAFEGLLDVHRARRSGIGPLPIVFDEPTRFRSGS